LVDDIFSVGEHVHVRSRKQINLSSLSSLLIKMLTQQDINFFIHTILRLPRNIEVSYTEMNNLIFPKRKYKIVGVYGSGTFGLILKIKSNSDYRTYALKLVRATANALKEFDIQNKFAQYNMAPQLYLSDITEAKFREYNVMFVRAVMDPIRNTVFQYLRSGNSPRKLFYAFECLIKKKFLLDYPFPYLHSDTHVNNIVILKDGKTLGFIDFGLAHHKPAELQILDCIPLIASCKLTLPRTVGEPLTEFLIRFYERMFHVPLVYSNFMEHPSGEGGYAYFVNGVYLHSYDWQPTQKRQRLIKPSELKRVFPTMKLPKVVD